jgi:basic amino acid/polyamine antiporter, APA family
MSTTHLHQTSTRTPKPMTSLAEPTPEAPLKRAISRNLLLLLVVGDVLGARIYALVGEVGGRVGGAIWTAFAVALALALFTAFSYAELVTKYPRAAGVALYVTRRGANRCSRSSWPSRWCARA